MLVLGSVEIGQLRHPVIQARNTLESPVLAHHLSCGVVIPCPFFGFCGRVCQSEKTNISKRLRLQVLNHRLEFRVMCFAVYRETACIVFHVYIVPNSPTGVKYFLRCVFNNMGVKYIIPKLLIPYNPPQPSPPIPTTSGRNP